MLFCGKCKIEFEDGNRFCSHCGSPLTPTAPHSSGRQNQVPIDIGPFDGKPFCPNCNIAYEFGSSCIKCGAALGNRTSFPEEKGAEPPQGPRIDINPVQEEETQEPQTEVPRDKLICPHCKLFYDKMKTCIRCGADLVPFQSFQLKEDPQVEGLLEDTPVPLPAEDRCETPEEELVCPYCNSVYSAEKGCRKCSPTPRKQLPSQEKQTPKRPPELEDMEEALETIYSQDTGEAPPQPRTSEKQALKKIEEEIKRRLSLLGRRGRDLRRSSFEAGSILILLVAAGYFLWSIYSNFIMKASEPIPSPTKKSVLLSPPVHSPSLPAPPPTPEPKEIRKESPQKNGPVATGAFSETPPPPLPVASAPSPSETHELNGIRVLLDNIRTANMKKDIHLFMACYANDFRDREKKRKSTLEIWDHFSYLDLSYELRNPSLAETTATANVEWRVTFFTKADRQPKESKSTLGVTFKKEGRDWKIKELRQGK